MLRLMTALLSVVIVYAASAFSALAQEFPLRTVMIVVPYPAGGSTDVLARALAAVEE